MKPGMGDGKTRMDAQPQRMCFDVLSQLDRSTSQEARNPSREKKHRSLSIYARILYHEEARVQGLMKSVAMRTNDPPSEDQIRYE